MTQSLVAPEVVTLVDDLRGASDVEVYYLDHRNVPQRAAYSAQALDEGVRIEMRPHVVVTRQIQDDFEPEG